MIKFYIEKGTSKKGYKFTALCCNSNGSKVVITFDKDIILRVLDVAPSEFVKLEEGTYELN